MNMLTFTYGDLDPMSALHESQVHSNHLNLFYYFIILDCILLYSNYNYLIVFELYFPSNI